MPQFELEPMLCYSGSYIEAVITGSLVVDRDRGKVGSTIYGDDVEYLSKTSLMDLADSFYNRATIKAGFKRGVDLICPDERFFDSLVPDFRTITKINGAKFVTPNWYANTMRTNYSQPLLNEDTHDGTLKLILGVPDTLYGSGIFGHLTASDGATITDDYWLNTYPFEYRYATANRLSNFNKATVVSQYTEVRAGGGSLQNMNIAVPGLLQWVPVTDLFPKTANFVTESNKFIVSVVFGSNQTDQALVMLNLFDTKVAITAPSPINYTQSNVKHLEENWFTWFYYGWFARGFPAGTSVGPPGNVLAPGNFLELVTTPPFYPFLGSGFIPLTIIPLQLVSFNFTTPRASGWKYGLLNGFAQFSKAVFRIGHFGHLRDMLEQRLYSKFYREVGFSDNGITRNLGSTSDSAVIVSFTPGTPDHAIAINQALNTRGSGIYDFECKSSKPWFDV